MAERKGQEGSRWVNQRPSGEEVASWFRDNVVLHDERLSHDHYVQGITLIQQEAEEKEVVGFTDEGAPVIAKRKHLYYVPYVKVETRVKYFWDFVALHDEWLGEIVAVPPETQIPSLPPGFGRLAVPTAEGRAVNYLTYSARARILERKTVEEKIYTNVLTGARQVVRTGKEIMSGLGGTKQVPLLGRFGPDPNAVMKAETGAVGRGLGLLGMLVLSGSGVATFEDMQEALQAEGGPSQAAPEPEQAKVEDDDAALRQKVVALLGDLEKADPKRHEEIRRWAREDRQIKLNEATQPQLRGLIRKLEQEIAESNAEEAQDD